MKTNIINISIPCINLFKKDLRAKHKDRRYASVGLSYSSTKLIRFIHYQLNKIVNI